MKSDPELIVKSHQCQLSRIEELHKKGLLSSCRYHPEIYQVRIEFYEQGFFSLNHLIRKYYIKEADSHSILECNLKFNGC